FLLTCYRVHTALRSFPTRRSSDLCWMSDSIFEVLEALEAMDESRQEAFLIWCDNGHRKLSEGNIDDLIRDFDDAYIGEYKDEERSEEHTSELQSRENLVCRLLLEK